MMDYLTDSLCSCESSDAFSALAKRVAHLEQYVLLLNIGLLATCVALTMQDKFNRGSIKFFREIKKDLDRLNRRG